MLKGFSYIKLKCSIDNTSPYRYIYFKPLTKQEDEQSLLVFNIPIVCYNSLDIKEIFSIFGAVESVEINGSIPLSSLVTFSSEESVKLSMKEILEYPIPLAGTSKQGITKWIQDAQDQIPDPVKLESTIKRFIDLFDIDEEKKNQEWASQPEKDEDGFTIIRSKKRHKSIPLKTIHDIPNEEKLYDDFYKFQKKGPNKQENKKKIKRELEEKNIIKKMQKTRPFTKISTSLF